MIKKLLLPFFALVVATSLLAPASHALLQVDELIIMVPEAQSGRNDRTISDALRAVPGVEVVGYCNSQKCFYLQVDRSQQPDDKNIIMAITALRYTPEVKVSGTIQQAQTNCADPQ